jgi:hypothetical protein
MYLFYIDDSRDEKLCVFSSLALPEDQWREALRKRLLGMECKNQRQRIFAI